MIAVIPLLVTLTLLAASPPTTCQLSSKCPNRSVTIPEHCSDAINQFNNLLLKVNNLTSRVTPTQDLPRALSETLAMFQPVFSVLCVDECLQLLVGCSQNVTEAIKNATYFTTCARAEDGIFCQIKLWQVSLSPRYLYRLLQNCSTPITCSSACQQSFRDLKTRMGCCATNYFETPSSPSYYYYKHYLANCSVPVGTTCNSASGIGGTTIVYLNVLLVIAAFLMTITIA